MAVSLSKTQVTKNARDAAAACFETGDATLRRPTTSNAVVALDEVYLCFNVQHRKWKSAQTLRFCVNYGVLPKQMFEENWTGYLGKYPQEVDCVFRSRLKPTLEPGDWWWRVADPDNLPGVLEQIQQAAQLVKTDVLPKVETAAGCLTHQTIANPNRASSVLDTLNEWRARYA